MARLPQEQRIAVALVLIEGLSYKEAAHVMDVPIGTLTSRLARAARRFRRCSARAEEAVMTFSDETVMAYVDGELDDATRAAVEARHGDGLGPRANVSRASVRLRARLHSEFDPVLREPIPERLLAAANRHLGEGAHRQHHRAQAHPGERLELAAVGCASGQPHPRRPHCAAVAARTEPRDRSAFGTARFLPPGPWRTRSRSSSPATRLPNAPVHVGVSFLSRNGDYCRTFTLRDKSAVAGLACREGEQLASGGTRGNGSCDFRIG